MSEDVKNFELWKSLLIAAYVIGEDSNKKRITRDYLVQQLSTVEENFGGSFDPAEDFQEYVILTFCRSVRKALAEY